ncbi:MAG: hypothetical protein MI861_13670, partial [Pirellulales bacterium]|nr:hypothetical protein [Pirellulales bacterium]
MMIRTACAAPLILFALAGFASPAAGQSGDWVAVDLLELIAPDRDVIRGDWKREQEGVSVRAGEKPSICSVPYELGDHYVLEMELTRTGGNDAVGVILPLGKRQVFLELSGWQGTAHGLSRVNKSAVRETTNPTRSVPGTLGNNERHRVIATVDIDAPDLAIAVELDGKSLIDYRGKLADVEANLAIRTDNRQRPALASSRVDVVFHSLQVRHPEGQGKTVTADRDVTNTVSPPGAN